MAPTKPSSGSRLSAMRCRCSSARNSADNRRVRCSACRNGAVGTTAVPGGLGEAALGEQPDDPVEGPGQGVGGRGHLLLNSFVVAFDAQIALGTPDLRLAIGIAVDGMTSHLLA